MSQMNNGLILGKFAPMHKGHKFAIMEAAMRCYELTVLVCIDHLHDPKFPTPEQRVKVVKDELKGFPNITVETVDCTAFPYAKESDKEVSKYWAEYLHNRYPCLGTLFGSEAYVEYVAEQWPKKPGIQHHIIDLDRDAVEISATEIRNKPVKNFEYLVDSAKPIFSKHVLVIGSESCVSPETEYFNGEEWKAIKDYQQGEQVLQYTEKGMGEMVFPERYIKEPCEFLYQFKNSYGNWTQTMCPNHDHVVLTSKGNIIKKKVSELVKNHFEKPSGISQKFITSFHMSGSKNTYETVDKLRIAVAISADGSLCKNQWRVRLIKKRKIERFRSLVMRSGYALDERVYEDKSHNFYLPKEAGTRVFPMELVFNLPELKEAFIHELSHWDSYVGKSSVQYSTTIKENANVVMTIASSMGRKFNFYEDVREDRNTCYRVEIPYNSGTRSFSINKHNKKHREEMITKVPSSDGFKYCFTVPSGMLILREKNHIFVTGNCGKSTLVRNLSSVLKAPMVPEMYRSMFPAKGMDFTAEDLVTVASSQNLAVKCQVESPYNKGIILHDTCNDVTLVYCKKYYPNSHLVHNTIESERNQNEVKFDLILFCDIDVPWEQDGTRTIGGEKERKEMRDVFYSLAVEKANRHGCPMVVLGADYKRIPDALKAIEEHL